MQHDPPPPSPIDYRPTGDAPRQTAPAAVQFIAGIGATFVTLAAIAGLLWVSRGSQFPIVLSFTLPLFGLAALTFF